MSKTDKTIPYRVARLRYGIEDHDHRNGVCDLAEHDPLIYGKRGWLYRSCTYEIGNVYWNDSRQNYKWERPRIVGEIAREENRKIRRRDAQLLHMIAKSDRDYDDTNFGQHRRNAEWLAY